jgi:hypothetical protein
MRVTEVKPRDGFRLEIVFADGRTVTVALGDRLFGPVFEPLRDPGLFRQVTVDPYGAVCWPNGADLAPDALYQLALSGAEWSPAQT